MNTQSREFKVPKTMFVYSGKNDAFQLQIEDLTLGRGDIIFLHGRSGCGKTTLLNLLSGVIESNMSSKCRDFFGLVSYVMHESTLLPWHSIENNIKIEAKLRNRDGDIDYFLMLCKAFGLEDKILRLNANKLSLGMRQRVEIAKALSFHPGLLLLDEALSGIDGFTKIKVAQQIWEEVEQKKTTIVGTAHQITDLLRLAQRIYLIDGGKIDEFIEIEKSVPQRLNARVEDLYCLDVAKALL